MHPACLGLLGTHPRGSGTRAGVDTRTGQSAGYGILTTDTQVRKRGNARRNPARNPPRSSMDTDVPGTLDAALSIPSLYEKLMPVVELNVFAVDFRQAYKNIPIDAENRSYCAILLAPPSGHLLEASLRTQPSGSSRAPENSARVAAFLRWISACVIRNAFRLRRWLICSGAGVRHRPGLPNNSRTFRFIRSVHRGKYGCHPYGPN